MLSQAAPYASIVTSDPVWKVREAIDDIGYSGNMHIEGAVPPGGKLVESYIQNRKFLQGIFPPDA